MELNKLNLMLFDGDAAGGGNVGSEGAPEGADKTAPGKAEKAEQGKPAKVIYGKQEALEGQQEAKPAESGKAPDEHVQDAPKTFQDLLRENEDYRKEHQMMIDKAINKRFAQVKGEGETLKKLQPAINTLCEKYGLKAGDVDALVQAVGKDDSLIEAAALDRGMSVETYRNVRATEIENQSLKEAAQVQERQKALESAYSTWNEQALEAKKTFPGLDLNAEIKNPQFAQLLGRGIDVKTAYQVVHYDEISQALVTRSAQEAQKNTVDNIMARQGRPRENGTRQQPGTIVKSDPSKLKRGDFDDIIKRAARGEKIQW